MGKLSRDLTPFTPLHPRENILTSATLSTLNSEQITRCDGCSIAMFDLRGTWSSVLTVYGSVTAVDWIALPVQPLLGGQYVNSIASNTPQVHVASCAGFNYVKIVVTTFVSGSVLVVTACSNAVLDPTLRSVIATSFFVTATGASGAAVTLTLPAPGAGLRQYITSIQVRRAAAAALTAAATPVLVTTTNLTGSPVFIVPANAALQGAIDGPEEFYRFPLVSTAPNTAVTIVAPIVTGGIWRLNAGYYVAA